jgi:bis(5'-nucleosyl)-tetraphosphatase (symmetrical)
MALYLIGDIQGCDSALDRLLQKIDFSASRDTLYVLGDLINRGPDNAGVLRRLMALGSSAHCLLGNHDLHLLAVSIGVRKANPQDTLQDVLQAPDAAILLHWLRHLPLAIAKDRLLMVHAGVVASWTLEQTLSLASEVENVLQSNDWQAFMPQMYGSLPNAWHPQLQGADRLRVIVNALTRMRFCDAQGHMNFQIKESAETAPAGFMPWFDVPHRQTAHDLVAFGHWSTLRPTARHDIICLDTGCVWGGCLSALQLPHTQIRDFAQGELIRVQCEQAQSPTASA